VQPAHTIHGQRRIARVTSEARARPRDEEETTGMPTSADPADEPTRATDATTTDAGADSDGAPGEEADRPTADDSAKDAVTVEDPAPATRSRGRKGRGDDGGDEGGRSRGRISLPLVPILSVLLVLLLAAAAFLWFTRPGESAVRTDDYAEALQAARSGVVDLTSFDYLTLDDDIEQVRRVATGDLREESVAQLDDRRQEITDLQAVVNTEVVGAGVTRATSEDATVLLVIQSTQQSTASPQAQIVRYRIEVTLEKSGDRWLLSGIKGTETPGND
jgi:Mce-associated membrane protein